MMHNCKGSIFILFFRFLLCLLACGCSDDTDMPGTPAGTDRVTACVRFSVRVAGASTRAAVSVGEAVEEKISSVAVFLVSVDGSGNEDWNDVQYEVVYGATSGATDVYQARIPTAPGRKKVYVGANLLPGQVHAICGQAGGLGLYTAAGDGYDEVIGQFARQAEGIAMTGKVADAVTVSAGTDVNIDLTASPVALERVVAKVLLVCDTYTDDGGAYVRMSDHAARPADDPGWIRLSEVRYALNTVNRKVYLNAPSDGKDPNYEVDPYVVKDGGGNYVSAPDVPEQQFAYRTLGSVWAEGSAPEAYDAPRYNATVTVPSTSGTYTGGLYCPENTTATSTASLEGGLDLTGTLSSTQAEIPRLVATHLLVAAKFVPKQIVTGVGTTQTLTSPADAATYLPATTTPAEAEAHAAGTYFTNGSDYYSYAGMKAAIGAGTLKRTDFTAYEGGIGYYYTYIDGTIATDGTIAFSTDSGILRNRYYLLCITRFSLPSAALPQPMRATMKVTDWVTSSGNTIIVRPT